MTNQRVDRQLRLITNQIVRDYQPDKVILFGSWAWGTPHHDSDVDLLVIKDSADPRGIARAIDGSLFPRPFPIDVLVCRPHAVLQRLKQGNQFMTQLMRKGKVLYAK